MKIKKFLFSVFIIACGISYSAPGAYAQVNKLPVRGYTSPEKIVTFDRTTKFKRALDVINKFARKYTGKIIMDRSNYKGPIGITIPPMHWRDALELILDKHYLTLIEQRKYFEIVSYTPNVASSGGKSAFASPDSGLTTHSYEVRIHAIFFEGNRKALQQIGVDWSTLTNNVPAGVSSFFGQKGGGGGGGNGVTVNGKNGLPIVGPAFSNGPFVNINAKGAKLVSQNLFNAVINLGEVFGTGISVQALFSAFEAENLGTILASPSIRVLEGQTGKIQVGKDFAINQRDFAGNVITQFYSAGTILQVVPQIIEYRDTTFIHLDIKVERSTVVPSTAQTTINTQNAQTQVLLLDGETTAIAGLYQTQMSKVRKGVPILKDLPAWFFGLRYLFGYTSKSYETRELIVLIKAEIVPSIAERMDEKLRGTFEVLQDRRLEIRRNIIKYRETVKYPDVLPTSDPQNIFEEDHRLKPADRVDNYEPNNNDQRPEVKERTSKVRKTKGEYTSIKDSDTDKQSVSTVNSAEVNVEKQILNYPKSQKQNHNKQRTAGKQSYKQQADKTEQAVSSSQQAVANNAVTSNETSYSYYIIGGAFKDKKNAVQLKNRLQRSGYQPAILKDAQRGLYRVAYGGFNSEKQAASFLSKIQRSENENAWILESN